MSTSISKICERIVGPEQSKQHEQQHSLKFKEFHDSMNEILVQLPVIEATRLTLDCMERANAALAQFSAKQWMNDYKNIFPFINKHHHFSFQMRFIHKIKENNFIWSINNKWPFFLCFLFWYTLFLVYWNDIQHLPHKIQKSNQWQYHLLIVKFYK